MRRVRSLHLTGASAEDLRAADHRVRDALRTASVPGVRPGRLLVVRSLPLGHIDPRRPPQALALRITERLRHLDTVAVPHSSPAARHAPAVWFPDLPTARALFLAGRATGVRPAAWFWRGAVQDPSPDAPVALLLRRWLAVRPALAANAPPPIVEVARLLAVLARQDSGPALLRELEEALALPWVGPEETAPPPLAARAIVPPAPLHAPGARRLLAVARTLPPTSARARFFAVAALVAEAPRRASDPRILVEARRRLPRAAPAPLPRPPTPAPVPEDRVHAPTPAPSPEPRPPAPTRERPPAPPSAVTFEPPSSPEPTPTPASPPPTPSSPPRPPPAWLDEAPPPRPERGRLSPPPALLDPALTGAGGLLFLLHPLGRLGLGLAHQDAPELLDQAFGWRVLDRAGHALGLASDDPILRAIAPTDPVEPPTPRPFQLPAPCWALLPVGAPLTQVSGPDSTFILGHAGTWLASWTGDAPGPLTDALARGRHPVLPGRSLDPIAALLAHADGWGRSALAWVERHVDLAPDALVARQAVVSSTPTHTDVVLPLSAIDLAIRRLALDVDPGWVPWLGRVVRFHYVENDDFSALAAEVATASDTPSRAPTSSTSGTSGR